MKNAIIYQNGTSVEAKLSMGTALQLHLVAEDLQLTSIKQNATCTVTVSDVIGCYHCLNGARLELACQSSENTVSAEVTCGHQLQLVTCTKTGHLNRLILNFASPTVNEKCVLACPGGQTEFNIYGSLEYVNDGLLRKEEIVNHNVIDPQFDVNTIISLLKTFISSAIEFVYSFVGLKIIFVLLILIIFRSILNTLTKELKTKKKV